VKLVPATYVTRLRSELRTLSTHYGIPLLVQLQLTYRCNLHCPACPCPGTEQAKSELDLHEIDAILAELSRMGTLYLLLSGGEILLRNDFYQIAHLARKKGLLLILSTNATLIGPAETQWLREISPLRVEVNLLGSTPVTHDAGTACPGSFHRTVSGVRRLREVGINVSVQEPPAEDWPRQEPGRNRRSQRIAETPLPAAIAEHLDCLPQRGVFPGRNRSLSTTCPAGRALATISPEGDVLPCPHLPFRLGNVRLEPFQRIWSRLHETSLEENRLALIPETCPVRSHSLFPCSAWPCATG
jgi:MoaA/NifB/PqqE/SkfB family radical SAM enzyme